MQKRTVDMTGQRYGKLTVIREIEPKRQPCGRLERMWECKCDCGKTVVYTQANIRSGNSKSCGCAKIIDLTGRRFGRLVVIEKGTPIQKPDRKEYYWICKCDCGKIVEKRQHSLLGGGVKSCGCIVRDGKYGDMQRHKLRGVWHSMLLRCNNPNHKSYKHYGGRGIKVCPEWEDINEGYINFYTWAFQNGYKEGLTIERIDYNRGYSPDNCRWITNDEQQLNKRTNRVIDYNGEKKCLSEWARLYNIRRDTLQYRLNHGWSIEEALNKPVNTSCYKRKGS